MGNVIRPVFTNGERLTAQRLNEIVEYLRTQLRRTLLAPLSPGVAAGLELGGAPPLNLPQPLSMATLAPLLATPTTTGVPTVTVSPGVAIDGVARILVSTQTLSFSYADIAVQIPDVAVGDQILISLAANHGTATPLAACAPTSGRSVTEGVQVLFTRITGTGTTPSSITPNFEANVFQPVVAWAEPIDTGAGAATYAVPLGSVITQQDPNTQIYTLIPSQAQRAGVMPAVGGLRNSDGDMSVVIDRVNGIPAVGVTVPTVFEQTAPAFFQTYAGGPLVQSAVVATDLGMPPAGRPTASAPNVFEAAGGNTGLPAVGAGGAGGPVGLPGTSGVMAVSMQYDIATGSALYGGFPTVTQSGFPLVLSLNNTTGQPLVSPPIPPTKAPSGTVGSPGNFAFIGLSAAPSQTDPNDPKGVRQIVPVAVAGIVLAYVSVGTATANQGPATMAVGTPLSPAQTPTGTSPQTWGLVSYLSDNSSGTVVAQLAAPLSNPSTTANPPLPAWVWIVSPYNFFWNQNFFSD